MYRLPNVLTPSMGSCCRAAARRSRAPLLRLGHQRRQPSVLRIDDQRGAQVRSRAALPRVHRVLFPVVVHRSRIDFRIGFRGLLVLGDRFLFGEERLVAQLLRALQPRVGRGIPHAAQIGLAPRCLRDGVCLELRLLLEGVGGRLDCRFRVGGRLRERLRCQTASARRGRPSTRRPPLRASGRWLSRASDSAYASFLRHRDERFGGLYSPSGVYIISSTNGTQLNSSS